MRHPPNLCPPPPRLLQVGSWFSNPSAGTDAAHAPVRSGVGKYISTAVLPAREPPAAAAAAAPVTAARGPAAGRGAGGDDDDDAGPAAKKPKVQSGSGYGNFDGW